MGLYDELNAYKYKNIYPMHMPGHKRNPTWLMGNPYEADITEIEGFDNLGRPQGILLDCMKRAAAIYGCKNSYLLVNGATAGILAAVSAMTEQGDSILIMRNSHIAVYNAAYIKKLRIQYLYPDTINHLGILGGITKELVEEKLKKHNNISLVIITSPTYEGILSDIKGIAEITHKNNIPLLVDSAHGAHLGFHPDFHVNASVLADCVIHGIHKTLPAFTQSALMHINGDYVSRRKVERYLSIYQTTSPSYIMMAGIDRCIEFLECHAKSEYLRFAKWLKNMYDFTDELENISIYRPKDNEGILMDPSKLIIYSKNQCMSGKEIYEALINKYRIQPEMAGASYTLCMTSVCDSNEGFERLMEALALLDKEHEQHKHSICIKNICTENMCEENICEKNICEENICIENTCIENIRRGDEKNIRKYFHYEAIDKPEKRIKLIESAGGISTEYVYLYPPGVPLLVPGEIISADMVKQIEDYKAAGMSINGMEDAKAEYIRIIRGG